MRVRSIGSQAVIFGFALGFAASLSTAEAAPRSRHTGHYAGHGHSVAHYFRGGLQCVPFARENTGIELAGNASAWWSAAEGVYQRGAKPEVGSVLNFRANGHMRMGHVAVVSNVFDSRNIEIDHANWAGPGAVRGGVSRNITVVDVSPGNDWTAVRVALGHTDQFGSVYPTYGFIYDRPDGGVMVANDTTAPAPVLNTPPRDLRPAAEQFAAAQDSEEVAEATDDVSSRGRRFGSRRGGSRAHVIMAAAHPTTRHVGATRVAAHASGAEPHGHHSAVRHHT